MTGRGPCGQAYALEEPLSSRGVMPNTLEEISMFTQLLLRSVEVASLDSGLGAQAVHKGKDGVREGS